MSSENHLERDVTYGSKMLEMFAIIQSKKAL